MFAESIDKVNPKYCQGRQDVALFNEVRKLERPSWHLTDRVEVRFLGCKRDQMHKDAVITRVRYDRVDHPNECRGPWMLR